MKHEQITAWALKELSPEEAARLEAQLQEDAATQQQAAQTKDFCDFLSAHLLDPHMALAPDQRASLQEAAVTSAAPSKKAQPIKAPLTNRRPWWQNPALSALAAAAVVTLLATGAWLVLPHSDQGSKTAALAPIETPKEISPSRLPQREERILAFEPLIEAHPAESSFVASPETISQPLKMAPADIRSELTRNEGNLDSLASNSPLTRSSTSLRVSGNLSPTVLPPAIPSPMGSSEADYTELDISTSLTYDAGTFRPSPSAIEGKISMGSGTNAAVGGNLAGNSSHVGDKSQVGLDIDNTSASTLAKSGAGTMPLSGANTYTGGTVVSAGVISGSTGNLMTQNQAVRGAAPSDPAPSSLFDQVGAKLEIGYDTQLAAAPAAPAAAPAPMEALVGKVMSEPLPPGGPQPGLAGKSAPAAATRSLALRSGGFHEEIIGLTDNEKDRGIRRPGPAPAPNNESYTAIVENVLQDVTRTPLSTFSIDVDTASYANVRRFLNQNTAPPPDAVRIEELINYFPTNAEGPGPDTKAPFAVGVEMAACPWQPQHRLARIAIKGRELGAAPKPSNLVFLVDVSGSMDEPNKLPLVQQSLRMLAEKLGEEDRVSMVVYAGSSGLVLPPTNGLEKAKILAAIDNLEAGGSTHGSSGIRLAYQQAVAGFIKGGVNRVILCTDGDFNVGVSSPEELEKLITEKARSGVFLSVLGYGTGNLKDRTMETLADKGNGNYSYIDSLSEARKVLVEQMGGTLVTIAKDVKIQVEFNPRVIRSYRLIGYENRLLAKEDFNDDTKDAGEIGAGHSVTALYELVSANLPPGADPRGLVDDLKYQPKPAAAPSAPDPALPAAGGRVPAEALTVKLRYKEPEGSTSQLIEVPVNDDDRRLDTASPEFRFTAAVAGFGLLLRHSSYSGALTWDHVRDLAQQGKGTDPHGYRGEFLQLLEKARGVTTR